MRRPLSAIAGVALLAETLAIVSVNVVLGLAVRRQSMSLAGLAPGAMSTGVWAAGGVFGLYLVVCAVVCLRAAWTGRAPGRLGRLLLVVCAVAQGVLGAAGVGMIGWFAFVAMMVILGLVVATLIVFAPSPAAAMAAPVAGARPANPTSP
jgi:hypothetical protein